ncbi:CCA tRNA nucleotidyltransferase [Sphingomonas piscis]|uniref:CCA tRNA nucleotidyltransferase n=1 Tax=Sphingomonas piscis TaxID=2714943 RepID=A0A6G7YRY2_9SPHN|nr:CCA tRNA nucleotidyltransferase [Sphingomonas piscis]QIK79492.1 CCA tRNA nucleotidyltransferase [Sphingomonas piscis]
MAVKLDVRRWAARPGISRLLDALGAADGATRYVGGAVRDGLLDLPVSDLDLATRFPPDEVQRRLGSAGIKAVPTGIAHGTVTAVSDGQVAEITTLRRDLSTDGRRATVAFTDDWTEDAGRRDFTINALSADPVSGEVFDYFGGLEDLRERRVRFIGDPLQRIAEDHLRIMRFFRFHARFGVGTPDPEAFQACVARANDLMALSRERIADELLKLLALPDPTATIALMVSSGVLAPVLPEIGPDAVGCLSALIRDEQAAHIPPDAFRRLAALLPRDPPTSEKLAARLKLSNKARKRLAAAADLKAPDDPKARAYRLGQEGAVDSLLLDRRPADAAAIANWEVPSLPIRGGQLVDRGIAQGPEVARRLRQIEDRWVAAGFPTGAALERLVDEVLG